MSSINPASFLGGSKGAWKVTRMETIIGTPLPTVDYVAIYPSHALSGELESTAWVLRGTNGQVRYSERKEVNELTTRQAGLNRPEATCAALIPIRKSDQWWQLPQDERRVVFEEESRHISMSMAYLPAIARRLYQCRELGESFDFLTWFEFAPQHVNLFDELVTKLRATREWEFVEREVDIRLLYNE